MRLDVLALCALHCAAPLAAAAPQAPEAGRPRASFLIVNPTGQGNQSQAQGFLAELEAALEAAWPTGFRAPDLTGRYHVTAADALASIRSDRPLFALTTTAFYLEHRDALGLQALLIPEREDATASRFHVVTRDAGRGRTEIAGGRAAGLRLGGQVAGEPDWARRAVLAAFPDASKAELVPVARTLEGVRRLMSDGLDGLLLHDAEWERLKRTGKAAGLVSAHVTAPLPEGPVVALGGGAGGDAAAETRAREAAEALQALSGSAAGRAVLSRMTLRGFKPATDKDYDAAARLLSSRGK